MTANETAPADPGKPPVQDKEWISFVTSWVLLGLFLNDYTQVLGWIEIRTGWLSWVIPHLAPLVFVLGGIWVSRQQTYPDLPVLGLALLVLGLPLMTVWSGEVLHIAGCMLIMSIVFRRFPGILLFITGAALSLVLVLWCLEHELEKYWDFSDRTYTAFWSFDGWLRALIFDGHYAILGWLGFGLLGIWIGRLDLHNPGRRVQLLMMGIGLYWIAGRLGWMFRPFDTQFYGTGLEGRELYYLLRAHPVFPGPMYFLRETGASLAILGLLISFFHVPGKKYLGKFMTLQGESPLSAYTFHILAGLSAIKWISPSTPTEMAGYALGIWTMTCLLLWAWNQKYTSGPIESLMQRMFADHPER
ncbi:MAG: hypothetical protein AAGI38_05910 [Bacteroidota bacterium]